MAISPVFRPCRFDELAGWDTDNQAAALAAFRRSAIYAESRPYRTGSLGVEHNAFAEAFAAARRLTEPSIDAARAFFESHFRSFRVMPADGRRGFVTGFYEPVVTASPVATSRFRFPLYRRPLDLVDINDGDRPADLEPGFAFARRTEAGLEEYFDRAAIDQGAITGRGLEIAWLADPVEGFFIHVQGAARLRFPDGTEKRITYAAKSGHSFTGPGSVLAALGEIPREQVTMQSIRAWFASRSDRIEEILWQNRSFIFFREAAVDDPDLGPVAAAKVPLTAGRSVAVDRLLHTFATPFFIFAPDVTQFEGKPFARLMIAQDTGSAITGAARGDLFAGSGDAAGDIAGVIRHKADFFALLPRMLVGDQDEPAA